MVNDNSSERIIFWNSKDSPGKTKITVPAAFFGTLSLNEVYFEMTNGSFSGFEQDSVNSNHIHIGSVRVTPQTYVTDPVRNYLNYCGTLLQQWLGLIARV